MVSLDSCQDKKQPCPHAPCVKLRQTGNSSYLAAWRRFFIGQLWVRHLCYTASFETPFLSYTALNTNSHPCLTSLELFFWC